MTDCLVNCCTVGLTLLAAVYEIFVQVEGEGPRRKGGVPGEQRRACKVFCVIKVSVLAIHWSLVDGAAILLGWAEEKNVCCLIDKRCVVGVHTNREVMHIASRSSSASWLTCVAPLPSPSVETSLLCCLVEGRGDLPAKAADMLSVYFHWPAGRSAQDGFTELEVLNRALRLCSTPGTACPHLGAQLFRMVFLR